METSDDPSRKQSIPQALRQRFPTLASTSARSLKIPSKGKRKTSSTVHKDIILLPNPDQKAVPTHRSRISLENLGFVVHEFPIDKAWGEEKLRFEIKKIFPVLEQKGSSFSFVKACYGEIVVPKIAEGVSMDATRVLSIAQQSCIYLRPDRILDGETKDLVEEISDSELEKCPWDGVTAGEERPSKQLCTRSSRNEIVDLTEGQRPSTTSHQGKSEQDILQEMFPSAPEREIRLAVEVYSSLHEAADYLAESSSVTQKENPVMEPKCTLGSILLELKQKMYSSEDRKKLKVDEDDLLEDALAFYKQPDFDPRYPVKLTYKGQPAADTGGVMRQFYSDLLYKLAEKYFCGTTRRVPLYNTDILMSGLMKMIGKIIVHSIVQGGPGFPFFSHAVFYYLATGSVEEAIQHLSIDECASPYYHDVVMKIQNAPDVKAVAEECLDVISECGLAIILTNENKEAVTQGILYHDAIGKCMVALDQLREGLSCLGFIEKMAKHSLLFKDLFVYTASPLCPATLLGAIKTPDAMSDSERKVAGFLTDFIMEASKDTLKNFLSFVTGAQSLPSFGLQTLEVKFSDTQSIFASTCLCEIHLPSSFANNEVFCESLEAVLTPSEKSFNCV